MALERKAVLAVALKEGGKFLAQFLGAKSCRLLQALFARREAQTLKMVAKLQKATRQMQVTTRARARSLPSLLIRFLSSSTVCLDVAGSVRAQQAGP